MTKMPKKIKAAGTEIDRNPNQVPIEAAKHLKRDIFPPLTDKEIQYRNSKALLFGITSAISGQGTPTTWFLSKEDEIEARVSFASLLRSENPLPKEFQLKLADLFDPTNEAHADARRLNFSFRTKGRGKGGFVRTEEADRLIALLVREACSHHTDLSSAIVEVASIANVGIPHITKMYNAAVKRDPSLNLK